MTEDDLKEINLRHVALNAALEHMRNNPTGKAEDVVSAAAEFATFLRGAVAKAAAQ